MTIPTYSSGLLFTQAHKAVRACIYEILEQYDLTPSCWAVIGAAMRAPEGIRLTTVAQQMDVKAPLVTMLAGDLISKGLINRVEHHTDKRAKLLVVTTKGKKMAVQIETELAIKIADLLKGASPEQIISFQKVLRIILSNAENASV